MPVKLVLGLQHGDEGKGRIVDDLCQTWANVIVRFQGGGNAGHTVYDERGKKFVTHILPVGVLNEDKISIISKGCVVNVVDLYEEIKLLNVSKKRLTLSSLCPVIEPVHILIDRSKYQSKIGTTAKGIGPAYSSYYARDSLLIRDVIKNPKACYNEIENRFFKFTSETRLFNKSPIVYKEIYTYFRHYLDNFYESINFLKDYVSYNDNLIQNLYSQNKNILLEGAQGAGLDITSTNYPNVTSSSPSVGGAMISTGLNHNQINEVIGVIKAYKTKVGAGKFESRCNDEDEKVLAFHGKEFGATTGRPRKCGWLDLDEVNESIRRNGVTHICLTKTDVFTNIAKPYVYADNGLYEISKIDDVSLDDKSFVNLLKIIKFKTGIKNITYTTGPNRGQIKWEVKI
jgi:adenylosuccinate synthase